MTNPALRYRPEIDGLRTLAVVPVVLFHAGITGFSGGFVGVDVFFVISGYLITTIILRECADGRFSILRFYERRARRILPALFLVMGVSIPAAWLLFFPRYFKDFGESVLATSLFASNFLFWRELGYFNTAAELKPLLHTWSLAVEEQFYILFPVAVVLLWRFGPKFVVGAILLTTIVSFALSDWASTRYVAANFYLLPTRAWELLVGSLAAAWLTYCSPPGLRLAESGAIVGITLIIVAVVIFDETIPFPGHATLLPVLGSALIILCAGPRTVTGRLLSLKPMVAVGLISYSAYLWHQPIFAFTRYVSLKDPSKPLMLSLSLVSFGLAWASWRYVEVPFRDRDLVSWPTVSKAGLVGIAVFFAIGMSIYLGDGFLRRFDPETRLLLAVEDENGRGREGCVAVETLPADGCVFNPQQQNRAFLWGDSHAMALAVGLAKELGDTGIALEAGTSHGCVAIQNVMRTGRDCKALSDEIMAYLKSDKSPRVIIIHSRWPWYFETSPFDNGEGELITSIGNTLSHVNGSAHGMDPAKWLSEELRYTLRSLLEAGKQIVFVGSVPEAGWSVARKLALRKITGRDGGDPLSVSADLISLRTANVRAAVAPLAGNTALHIVEPFDVFCNTYLPGRCVHEIEGRAAYRDGDHLSFFGASLLAPVVAGVVQLLQ